MNAIIQAKEFHLGKNSFIHPTAVIRGLDGDAKRVSIGDNVYIGENVQIIVEEFEIGDYSKIHHHTNIHGYKPCKMGHNCWIGQYTLIDSIGGTTVGNNCGIGAHSQLWSHIKYGDSLEGCRFNSETPLKIGNDVWFVGHCIVSPITAEDKSMALVGSVVTKNMEKNSIYAGVPAQLVSGKIGFQFQEVPIAEKFAKMTAYVDLAQVDSRRIKIVQSPQDFGDDPDVSYFSIETRTYTKRLTDDEIKFMKYLLPEKAKFTPHPETN